MPGWCPFSAGVPPKEPEGEDPHEDLYWFMICTDCGHRRSYWALGVSSLTVAPGDLSTAFCAQCHRLTRFRSLRLATAAEEDRGRDRGWLRRTWWWQRR